jgi:[protein-PII] uridylyltransferase
VPDVSTLELLHALTWADAEATGPAVRSEWRRGLIADLVRRCVSQLGGAHLDATPSTSPAIEQALTESGDTTVLLVPTDDGCSIVVSTPDRVGVLAVVAGVLSSFRLQIRGARIRTEGQRAAQEWFARPLFGDLPDERAIASDVRAALSGDLDIAARLEKRRNPTGLTAPRGADPIVLIDESATHHTVVEVRAHDEPMLLYRITSALAAADVAVVGAKIDTLGSEVVDAFFVTDRTGAPLSIDHAQAVRTTVQATLRQADTAR